MKRITFHVGCGFDANGDELVNIKAMLGMAQEHLGSTYGGFTIRHCDGGWKDNKGKLVLEPSLEMVVYYTDSPRQNAWDSAQDVLCPTREAQVLKTAQYLKTVFNQSCVLVATETVELESV